MSPSHYKEVHSFTLHLRTFICLINKTYLQWTLSKAHNGCADPNVLLKGFCNTQYYKHETASHLGHF